MSSARGRPRGFDRDRALRLAMELFWEHGYEGTSVNDLTTAMGIRAPSLYAAFGSKEGLFRETVELYRSDPNAPVDQAVGASTAKTAIEAMLWTAAWVYSQPARPRGCMVVLAATSRAPEHDAVARFLSGCRAGSYQTLHERLRRGVSDGDVPAGTDVAAVASFYVTVFHGMSIQARDGCSRQTLESIADSAMRAWDGIVHPG